MLRWFSRFLTNEIMQTKLEIDQRFLQHYERNGNNHKIVIGDESWIHHYDFRAEKSVYEISPYFTENQKS